MSDTEFDLITLGEVLVEVAVEEPFRHGLDARLSLSGDAFNAALASARAGARVALAAVLPKDELGAAICAQIEKFGISTELLRFRDGQQGFYLVHSDPAGEREFAYARAGSVGSSLSPDDLDPDVLKSAGAVLTSGITAALSESAREAVRYSARQASRFAFDPNFRPRLTEARPARELLLELAPLAYLITPSSPAETSGLLGVETPGEAAAMLRGLGTKLVAVTCGARGVHVETAAGSTWVDAVPAPVVVDQTGAGDVFVGTLISRLVGGQTPEVAVRTAAAASSLAVGGRGGAGLVPTLDQTLAHADLGSGA